MKVDSNFVMSINGDAVTTEHTQPVYNPATRAVFAQVPDASREQLDQTVGFARAALKGWAATPVEGRQAALERYASLIEAHAEEFVSLLTREQGKPKAGAEWEVFGSIDWLRAVASQRLPDEVIEDSDDRRVVTRFTPVGVVGAIVPWNFPILLAIWKIAPALMAGCTMILKPSPYTPLCDLKLVELAQEAFPPGVINAVSGGDDLGIWMTTHPDINKIAFTGSTETGRHVMKSASETIKRVTLELGGNDPAIVLPDVDAKTVAPQLFWAAFQNNAQFCNSTKRLYIHEDVYDEVKNALVDFINENVKVGDGAEADTDLGPIQNSMQYGKVQDYFADCHANGYGFAVGGDIDETAAGWFVPVSLVDNPPDDSRIVCEEPFGPILPLLKWSDEADVVARANDTIYGLGASVWGKDQKAVERIGSQLEAGTVWLNEVHQYSPFQAFGGHKQSGLGCENSLHGLMEYTNWQTMTLHKKAAV
ncbi:aldehyde dehydrogenase family protein [Draconibacterium sp.]|nr:aldehyde dehydrogenase family protein [Luminiphilus sp.]MDB2616315.1 aldehyde dehydrogenase family protein [Luminiphilus sp.]MDB3923079.1 aldehyde dehydrogenase family protein [Luminiphilus sp.]MDB4582076.1 aldehyde dehydrogenase family protein [Draconibacterium sp.]